LRKHFAQAMPRWTPKKPAPANTAISPACAAKTKYWMRDFWQTTTRSRIMTSDPIQQDETARQQALDISQSFIVQAPAGSGKTGLLIQRYLALLATVERPEQILAITFTKKAASEMRERVLKALHDAKNNPLPEKTYEQQTWRLARKIIDNNQLVNEKNLFSPQSIAQRLRIQTIDALCSELVMRMPITSRMGNAMTPVENSEPLLRETARRVLAQLESENNISDATEILLQHLDNDFAIVETLLMRMLARRDQWLRHLTGRDQPRLQREILEAGWRDLVIEQLEDLREAIADLPEQELCELTRYAASNLTQTESKILACQDIQTFPEALPEGLPQWRGLAALLLTAEGEWRKPGGINKNIGFPAIEGSKKTEQNILREQMKARMQAYHEIAAGDSALAQKLHTARGLPAEGYSEPQWQVLNALLDLLPQAVTTLRTVFAETGQCDFAEIAQGALHALGNPDEPTDLMLALDYRIQHILIDEFQDTSVSQFELLQRLTAGWQPGDGRSLFIVGDPMQSIYRFREADVSLFLRAQFYGVGDLQPVPLLLSRNFRSQYGIVDWVNQTFDQVFPPEGDLASGAVSYAPSAATKPALPGAAVHIHALFDTDWKTQQALHVAELADAAIKVNPDQTIAVLARGRKHLAEIVQAFNRQHIAFTAVEIDELQQRPVVMDLTALTRAHLNPADRTAWLSVLRAPWCGLSLADLSALSENDSTKTIWQLLHDPARLASLSSDGSARLNKLLKVMQASLPQRDRASLRAWIESAWLALGGPACVASSNDLDDAASFFDMLEVFSEQDFSVEALDSRLGKLYAQQSQQVKSPVQVMTMHKSKGLEFDVVILPSLSAKPRGSDSPLMLWQEYATRDGHNHLLLAPISARGEAADPLYLLAKNLDAKRDEHETQRLLYVAATRAKQQLHIYGPGKLDDKGKIKPPASASLLKQLWPVVEPIFTQAAAQQAPSTMATNVSAAPSPTPFISRLTAGWQLPALPATVGVSTTTMTQSEIIETLPSVEYLWVGDTTRHVGTVVHQILRRAAMEGTAKWNAGRLEALQAICRARLLQLGVNASEIDDALKRVMSALRASVDDKRGLWILDHSHQASATELAMTSVLDGELVNVIIDRTFVDANGTRWIIDYKTSTHEGADTEKFLDNEVLRYKGQLERYRAVMSQMDKRPIRCGLYFPLLRGWREW
jgi:ATP-dependent helicase/nuclease subunit A